jgi:hypothetical protein
VPHNWPISHEIARRSLYLGVPSLAVPSRILANLQAPKGSEGNRCDNTTVIIYYTGHGWRTTSAGVSEFYLIPYDVREGEIKSHALRAEGFAEAVGKLKPRRLLVVLDCCHASGMGVKGEGSPPPHGYMEAAFPPSLLMEGEKSKVGPGMKGLETLAKGHGRAAFSSSTGDQKSYLRRDGKMSIFTYHLIEALTGHAEPKEGATEVLVSDMMSFVWRRVPQSAEADWGQKQEPDFQVSGNFPVALLLGGKGLGRGQSAPDPLEISIGERADEDCVEKYSQSAFGSYIAQADRGSTATISVNQLED